MELVSSNGKGVSRRQYGRENRGRAISNCNLVACPINGVYSEYISQGGPGASGAVSDRSLAEIDLSTM